MEGKVQVGGIKAPATRLKRRDLVQKLSKLEAKIAKLKELKKSKNVKDGDGEADGEDGRSYKELYQNAKSGYDGEYQKRVDCEKENTRLEGDNRDLKFEIETLKSEVVTLVHPRVILDKEISYK